MAEQNVSQKTVLPVWLQYINTILIVALLTFALLLIFPIFPIAEFPVIYMLAIVIIAYFFGNGPTILAIILGFFSFKYFFIPPVGEFFPLFVSPMDFAALIAYLIGTILVGIATILMRKAKEDAQQRALEREQYNRKVTEILESITDAFFRIDSEWRFTYVNSEAEELMQRSRYELIGKNMWDIFPEIVGSRFKEEYERAIENQITVEFEEYHTVLQRWLEVRVYPSANGLSVYLHDITDRVLLKNKMENQLIMLQRALLPGKPSLGNSYQIDAKYIPAYAGEEIGGDFFDVFSVDKNKACILIGDVSGKGIEAAAIAAITRSSIQAFAQNAFIPTKILNQTNKLLINRHDEFEGFVTVFLGTLFLPTGKLTYCCAGHPSAAVFRASGNEIEFSEIRSPALGFDEKSVYREGQITLQMGDKLILYTDGISEARRKNIFFDYDGVSRVLVEYGNFSVEDIVNQMVLSVRDWQGGKFKDDIAVMAIERGSRFQ